MGTNVFAVFVVDNVESNLSPFRAGVV